MSFELITNDADGMGGVPCIRGLRIPVATVIAMLADGMTADEIIVDLPDLTPRGHHRSPAVCGCGGA